MSPRPYCSHCEGGVWVVDPDTGDATKCPHCAPIKHVSEFHADVAADAHPQAAAAALAIIRDAARTRQTFTSNDIRDQLTAAQIPGPVVGAAFNKAARDGIIRATGDYVPSTQAETHGHPVKVWGSRVYRGSAA